MEVIDINTWKRKQHFEHFSAMADPYFGVTIPFDVTHTYKLSKEKNISFFGMYLHNCMKAINEVDALRLRVEDEKIIKYDTILASATLMRADNTFTLSYIRFSSDLNEFIHNIDEEKNRILSTNDFYPPEEDKLDCIHCSALPWINFTGHKEAISGKFDTVPKLAFSKAVKSTDKLEMNVAIYANHAVVDGYDVGLFAEKFQQYLNK